jgi:formate hydrogenlyase subunit 3/multisubunit Na+/H+ antiporter MnhD subunit
LILLVLPLAAAAVTYLVRRWAILAALIAALTSGTVAILSLRLPLDQTAFVLGREVAFGRPVVVLGRVLVLNPGDQIWLAFMFGLAVVLYLISWRISQGRAFFSFSLAILSLYALVVLLQSLSLAILVFAISATLAIFVVQGGVGPSIRGSQRYLLVTLLSVPLLLTAVWLVDQSLAAPENAVLASQALLPTLLGFGLLLAVFPFGTWMPALAADAPPLATAFIFTVSQAMTLYLLLVFLRNSPWMLEESALPTFIQLAGLLMAASGGVMAAVQQDFGRLFGYAALSDLGYLLLASVVGGSQGEILTLLYVTNRAVSITLMAAGLAILRHRAATDQFAGLQGVARKLPVATLGVMIGGLALAGFPLTAGFPIHWSVSRAVWSWAQPLAAFAGEAAEGTLPLSDVRWPEVLSVLALLASSVGITVGLLRGFGAMLGEVREDVGRQPVIASFMVLALAGLVIVLGLHPQLFLGPVRTAVEALAQF